MTTTEAIGLSVVIGLISFFSGKEVEFSRIESDTRKRVSCEQHQFINGSIKCVAVTVRP